VAFNKGHAEEVERVHGFMREGMADVLNLKDVNREKADVIYRAGCMLSFDPEMWGMARDAVTLLQQTGVDVGIQSREEAC